MVGLCLNGGPDPAIAAIAGVGRLGKFANGQTLCTFFGVSFGCLFGSAPKYHKLDFLYDIWYI